MIDNRPSLRQFSLLCMDCSSSILHMQDCNMEWSSVKQKKWRGRGRSRCLHRENSHARKKKAELWWPVSVTSIFLYGAAPYQRAASVAMYCREVQLWYRFPVRTRPEPHWSQCGYLPGSGLLNGQLVHFVLQGNFCFFVSFQGSVFQYRWNRYKTYREGSGSCLTEW